jgi:GT2 family glycosyltransferase
VKHLVSICAYGGLPFLEICLRSIQETVKTPDIGILVTVAKPNDSEMKRWLDERGFNHIDHHDNKGFAGSINDALDVAFIDGNYDTLTILGNDTVLMPGALDSMVEYAETTDWEMLCGSEFDVRFLHANYPEIRHLFTGPNLVFNDFSQRPWEVHKDFRENTIQPDTLKDVRNFTLYKKSVFEKVGYADVNFYKNGYYEDLCYARRCHLLGIKAAGLPGSSFFHWWSRTIHQNEAGDHGKFYERNAQYYEWKYGTRTWGEEKYQLPFNGQPFTLPGSDIVIPATLDIPDRDQESKIISYWRNL